MPLDLACFIASDVPSWERRALDPIIQSLSESWSVEVRHIKHKEKRVAKGVDASRYWLLCREWRTSLATLGRLPKNRTLFCSVFGHSQKTSVSTILARFRKRAYPSHVHFLTHSPINFRFYKELLRVPQSQLSFLPLAWPGYVQSEWGHGKEKTNDGPLTVGTFGDFVSESNLHFLQVVAHALKLRKSDLTIVFFGKGPLKDHVQELQRGFQLNNIRIQESENIEDIQNLDAFLYTPVQNGHFLPVLASAAARVPIIANEVTGIEEYIQNDQTGFILPVNEAHPFADKLVTLSGDAKLRHSLAEKSYHMLREKFAAQAVTDQYRQLFGQASAKRVTQAA